MAANRKVKPISFRVYPEGRFLYCEVNIWPTKKSMLVHTKLGGDKYEACCGGREGYVVEPKRRGGRQRVRKTGLFAEANFHREAIGIEVISHEFTHATFCFADRRKLPLGECVDKKFEKNDRFNTLELDGPEERFCYALGQMCRQFTQRCYDLGLYQAVVESR